MPFYRLLCRQCGCAFEQQASISARTDKQITCPQCGSTELEPDYSAGSAHVQVKKAGDTCPHRSQCGCGGSCGGHHG